VPGRARGTGGETPRFRAAPQHTVRGGWDVVGVELLQVRYPGIGIEDLPGELRIMIPDRYRVGHFGAVTRQFLEYLREPGTLPAWEKPNMLAKYFVICASNSWRETARKGRCPVSSS
jgi:hypothetical protein